jgi:catecholate siderophore receptor
MTGFRTLSLAALLTSIPATAQADPQPGSVDGAQFADAGQAIIVTGQREIDYAIRRTATATRTDSDLKDVPQAISIITAAQIKDQGMRSVSDVLRFVPGAALSAGEGHRDQIVLRGNSSTADFFVDGLRDDVQYYRGLYNLERVEVLKGPNAMIFGRGGGGGIVNRVTKRPEARRFVRSAMSLDRFGAGFAEADVNSPLSGWGQARLNAVYERFDNFRDAFGGHRLGINPTVAWLAGADTRIDAGFEFARDRRVVDRGIPSARAGTIDDPSGPLKGHDRTLFGDRDLNRARFTGKTADLRVEHRFGDRLKLVGKALYGDYDKFYRNVMAVTPVTLSGGVQRVGIEAYEAPTRRRNLLVQNDLVAELATGSVDHTLLVGIDYSNQRTHAGRRQGFFAPGPFTASSNRRFFTPLADDIFVPAIAFTCVPSLGCTDAKSRGNALGLYAQDQARIGEHVEIVAGLRRDHFKLSVANRLNGQRFDRSDALWSPRLGLVIKPTARLSLYASWSRSFLPQSGDQFSSLDVTTAALEPETFGNREIGLKWQPLPALDVTLAAYRLARTHTRATDPSTNRTVLTGAQLSKGVELTVQGRPLPQLALSGGLAFQDAEISRTTSAAPKGREVPLVPHFQASLWGRYDVTERVGAGLGLYHQSKSFASISNAVVVPGFTRVDAAGYFQVRDGVELQLNVDNLLDADYIGLAFNDNNLTPASPRTLRATLRLGF